jgi:hypothetical protein
MSSTLATHIGSARKSIQFKRNPSALIFTGTYPEMLCKHCDSIDPEHLPKEDVVRHHSSYEDLVASAEEGCGLCSIIQKNLYQSAKDAGVSLGLGNECAITYGRCSEADTSLAEIYFASDKIRTNFGVCAPTGTNQSRLSSSFLSVQLSTVFRLISCQIRHRRWTAPHIVPN